MTTLLSKMYTFLYFIYSLFIFLGCPLEKWLSTVYNAQYLRGTLSSRLSPAGVALGLFFSNKVLFVMLLLSRPELWIKMADDSERVPPPFPESEQRETDPADGESDEDSDDFEGEDIFTGNVSAGGMGLGNKNSNDVLSGCWAAAKLVRLASVLLLLPRPRIGCSLFSQNENIKCVVNSESVK